MAAGCEEVTLQKTIEYLVSKWKSEQLELSSKVVVLDDVEFLAEYDGASPFPGLKFIGGVDISFYKEDETHAVAGLVVIKYPSMELIYKDMVLIHLSQPYVPEYLAFREVRFHVSLLERLKETQPDIFPQIVMVDGNGILHPRRMGVASHLGVLFDIPTIGVAKTLFHVDGIEQDEAFKHKKDDMKETGDSFNLITSNGQVLGKAMKTTQSSTKPVFVSIGHRITLQSASEIVLACCKYRLPEPVRQADILSREHLRCHIEGHLESCESAKGSV